jgi:hypothetical protein
MTLLGKAQMVSAIGGAALVSWQLAGKLDTALVAHLDAKFATKEDLARVEKKIDEVLDLSIQIQKGDVEANKSRK